MGFTKIETPCDVPDSVSGLFLGHFLIIRAKRVSNSNSHLRYTAIQGYIQKKNLCVCSTNLGFSGGSANRYCCRTLRQYDTRYQGTYYVPDTYVPGISRQKYLRTYVMFLFLFPLFVSARHPHIFGIKSTWNLSTIVY